MRYLLLGTKILAALLLLVGPKEVTGQSALDGFDPKANDYVGVIVVQPDGKSLIGGGFSWLAPNGGLPVTRHHIARLNPDGTLDAAFDPDANERIFCIALQEDGKILVGGDFTAIGGQNRNAIARLDPITGLADSFDPNMDANGFVRAIVPQPGGKILVVGGFTTIGGQTRHNIARLDATTGLADSFDPNADSEIVSVAVQADSKILLGGYFTQIGGHQRSRMARLDPNTGLADSFNPNANGEVFSSIAGGRKNNRGRLFQRTRQYRRTNSQLHCAA